MLGIRRRIRGALRDRGESGESAKKKSARVVGPAPVAASGSFSAAARAISLGESPELGSPSPVSLPTESTMNSFWGLVDNESARAKHNGETLDIDRNECIGCGTCVENTEEVFFLNDDECKAYVIAQEGDMELVQDAIDACPVTCISWK